MGEEDSARYVVDRPVWRSFRARFLKNAAEHVRRGGFAAVLLPNGHVKVLLPRTRKGEITELARWALLSIEVRRYGKARRGPARGIPVIRVKERDRDIVHEWCERDGTMPESTYRVRLDCRTCGACCRDNRVILEPHDLARWRRAGRDDLLGRAYVRTSGGQVLLRLARDGGCVHLEQPNHTCSIYELRPDNCSAFPAGSEACLAARLETLGVVD